MKLILHLVRTDVVRFRLWWSLWLLLQLAKLAFGFWVLAQNGVAGDSARARSIQSAFMALLATEGIFIYLVTVLVVQADGLVGSQSSWMTRPISGPRLFAAKALTLGLVLGVGPAVVALPWWIYCELGVNQIAGAAVHLMAFALVPAVIGAFFAACTDSLARALVWTTVLLVAAGTGMLFWMQFKIGLLRTLPTFGFAAVALAVAVAVQYFRRRTARTVAWAAGGLLAAVAIGLVAPWNSFTAMQEKNAAAAQAVRLVPAVASISIPAQKPLPTANEAARPAHLRIGFRVEGVGRGLAMSGLDAQHRFTWRDGPSLARWGWLSGGWESGPEVDLLGVGKVTKDLETERYLEAERARRQAGRQSPARRNYAFSAFMDVPPSFAMRMKENQPAYQADLWLYLTRPRTHADFPVEPGPWIGLKPGIMQIRRVGHLVSMPVTHQGNWRYRQAGAPSDSAEIDLVEAHGLLPSDLFLAEVTRYRWRRNTYQGELLAINRPLGQVQSVHGATESVFVNMVEIRWRQANVRAPAIRRDDRWVRWPEWMKDVRLVSVFHHEEAVFRRQVSIERLPVE